MKSRRHTTRKALKDVLLLLTFVLLLSVLRNPFKVDLLGYQRLVLIESVSFYKSPQKRLEFVHIPKTGGTIIEAVASKGGIAWTICHFLPPSDVAAMSINIIQCPNRGDKDHAKWKGVTPFHGLVWWHLPPSYFFNYADVLPANPYNGADMFAVVRDPYSRLISEYYYQQSWLVSAEKRRLTQDVRYFNKWIKIKLETYSHSYCERSAKSDLFQSTNATKSYLSFDGHLISQYDYIFDGSAAGRTAVPNRIVKHVLRFENLTQEYNAIMEDYGLGHLTPLPREHVRKSLPKHLGLYNLTLDNLRLIERVYRRDFEEFGYKMQSSSIPSDILKRNSHLVRCKANVTLFRIEAGENRLLGGEGGDGDTNSIDRDDDVGFEVLQIFPLSMDKQ